MLSSESRSLLDRSVHSIYSMMQ